MDSYYRNKLKSILKNGLFSLGSNTFIQEFLLERGCNKNVIFCFHRILPDPISFNEFPGIDYVVGLNNFSEFLSYVSSQYNCVDLDTFLASRSDIKKKPLCHITFDDGYSDNFEYALPLLKRFNIPATIYITTDYLTRELVPIHFYLHQLINDADNDYFKEISFALNKYHNTSHNKQLRNDPRSFFEQQVNAIKVTPAHKLRTPVQKMKSK